MSKNAKHIKVISTARKLATPKDVLYTPEGQWKYPGQVTKIPSSDITMQGVPYPVLGVDNLGNQQMMQPGAHYTFPGQYVTEYPQVAYGGDPSLHAVGGWLDEMQKGGTKIYTDKAAYNKAHRAEMDSLYTYKHPLDLSYVDYTFKGGKIALSEKYKQKDIMPISATREGDMFKAVYKKPVIHNKYQKPEPVIEPIKEQLKKTEPVKDYVTRNVDFSSPYGAVMKYYDADGKVIRTEPYTPKKQMGGWLDELDEEFKRGGPTNPLMLSRSKRNKTSKNIQSSINKIFLRNHDLFGPGGKNIYDPKSKYEFGGDLDEYQNAGSTGVKQPYIQAIKTPSKKMQLSNDDVVKAVQSIHDNPENEYNIRGNVNEADWARINSLIQSPQGQKLAPKSHDDWNLLMPDNKGSYTDSGVSPFDLMLGAPQDVIKTLASKAVKGLPNKSITNRVIAPSKTSSKLPPELEPYISKKVPDLKDIYEEGLSAEELQKKYADAIEHFDRQGNNIPEPEQKSMLWALNPMNYLGEKLPSQLYRKIGSKKGMKSLLENKGAQSPTEPSTFWGYGKKPNENYSGVFALGYDQKNPNRLVKDFSSFNGPRGRHRGVSPFNEKGRLMKNIPLEDEALSVYRRLPFSNSYKNIPKDELATSLWANPQLAYLQHAAERAGKIAAGIGAHDYIADDKNDWYPQIQKYLTQKLTTKEYGGQSRWLDNLTDI